MSNESSSNTEAVAKAPARRRWPFRECVGDPCADRIETALTRSTTRTNAMTLESIHSALLQSIEAEAATEILRMLTSDRSEPLVRCDADGRNHLPGH